MRTVLTRFQNLFVPPLQEFSHQTNTANVLDLIRQRVVTVLLRLCVLFGLISVSVGTVALWYDRDLVGIAIGNISFIGIVFLAFSRKLDHKIRSAFFIILAFAFVFLNIFKEINEFSFIPLFSFVIMTTLLMGRRGGLLAFIVSLLIIYFAQWQVTNGSLFVTRSMSLLSDPPIKILATYTDWLFFAGIFFFTIWIYFDGFHIAWEREQKAAALLAQERDRLAAAFAREKELLAQLNEAHQREIELSRLKSQIITTISHEFRTPLTVINNSAELLTHYADKFSEDRKRAIQQRIEESVYYLTELLQDTSLVNKAYGQGFQANLIRLPLNGLGQRLKKDLLQALNEPDQLIFLYDKGDETAVCLDYDFTYRIIFSFLTNALKYSPITEPLTIDIQRDKQLCIAVTDKGIGIEPDELHHIWELFYRGRNVSNKHGLGFGLYLTKRLAQAMEGTVTAVSPGPNQGSTFTLHIPQRSC